MAKPVEKIIEVKCTPETAFRVFTSGIDSWWPKDRNSLSAMEGKKAQSISLDPRLGGAMIEIAHDGKRHVWGSVTRYEPPGRLTIAWHVGSEPDKATTVDVLFRPVDGGTRVELSHHGWEVLDDPQGAREGYNNGWVGVFEEAFAQACAHEAA